MNGDAFEGLGCISDTDYHIKTDKTYQPVVHPPILKSTSYFATQDPRRIDQNGRIRRNQKAAEPTDWVNSMVTIVKPNGSLRICIYPHDMNKAIKCEPCTIEDIVTKMPNAKVFTVLDASSRFWQVKPLKCQVVYI